MEAAVSTISLGFDSTSSNSFEILLMVDKMVRPSPADAMHQKSRAESWRKFACSAIVSISFGKTQMARLLLMYDLT